jgi:hypothetical protein
MLMRGLPPSAGQLSGLLCVEVVVEEEVMFSLTLIYLGAAILFVWGVAHILPTRNVVAGFGPLSEDNRINITMKWVAERLVLAVAVVLLVAGNLL